MDLNYTAEDLAFRDTVRAFLEANLPADLQQKVRNHLRLQKEDYVRWHQIAARQGHRAVRRPGIDHHDLSGLSGSSVDSYEDGNQAKDPAESCLHQCGVLPELD